MNEKGVKGGGKEEGVRRSEKGGGRSDKGGKRSEKGGRREKGGERRKKSRKRGRGASEGEQESLAVRAIKRFSAWRRRPYHHNITKAWTRVGFECGY